MPLRSKYVNVTLALDSTRFLRNETEYIPWRAAIRNLQYFILMFERTEVYGPMQVLTHILAHKQLYSGITFSIPHAFLQKSDIKVLSSPQTYIRKQAEILYDYFSNYTNNSTVPPEHSSQ